MLVVRTRRHAAYPGSSGLARSRENPPHSMPEPSPGVAASTAWPLRTARSLGGSGPVADIRARAGPRSWLKRPGAAKGLWYSIHDVGPDRIRGVITFGELSRSPVEETAGK